MFCATLCPAVMFGRICVSPSSGRRSRSTSTSSRRWRERDDDPAAHAARGRARRRRLDERDAADVAGVAAAGAAALPRRARPDVADEGRREVDAGAARAGRADGDDVTISWLPPLRSTSTLIAVVHLSAARVRWRAAR